MESKYLIIIDEQSQTGTINNLKSHFLNEGIELEVEQINPNSFPGRENRQPVIDRIALKNAIDKISFFRRADVIACDYNLVANQLNGFEVILMIRELGYKPKKQVILYSAKLENVLEDILQMSKGLDEQINALKKLMQANIEFVKRDNYKDEIIRQINQIPEFDFDDELCKWLNKRDKDCFKPAITSYQGETLGKIAEEIQNDTPQSITFKKELVEQLFSYLIKINELDE